MMSTKFLTNNLIAKSLNEDRYINRFLLKSLPIVIGGFVARFLYPLYEIFVINGYSFTARGYNQLLFAEFRTVYVREFILTVFPTFIALKLLFREQRTWLLALAALFLGLAFGYQEYMFKTNRWQSLQQYIEGLPIQNVSYFRSKASFPDGSNLIIISFELPEDSWEKTAKIIESRIPRQPDGAGKISYYPSFSVYKRSPSGEEYSPEAYDISQYEGVIKAFIHTPYQPKY